MYHETVQAPRAIIGYRIESDQEEDADIFRKRRKGRPVYGVPNDLLLSFLTERMQDDEDKTREIIKIFPQRSRYSIFFRLIGLGAMRA